MLMNNPKHITARVINARQVARDVQLTLTQAQLHESISYNFLGEG